MPSERRPSEALTDAYWGREPGPWSEADRGREAGPLVRAPLGIEGTFPISGAPISSVQLAPGFDPAPEAPRVSVAFAPAATDSPMPWREELGFAARARSWFSPTGPRRRRER